MAYLTDKEKRLLFSALTREKKVCVEVDKEYCREPYEDTLESIVKNLEKKFYYDRFEKEIRAKAIDEFTHQLKENLNQEFPSNYESTRPYFSLENARLIIDDGSRADEKRGVECLLMQDCTKYMLE